MFLSLISKIYMSGKDSVEDVDGRPVHDYKTRQMYKKWEKDWKWWQMHDSWLPKLLAYFYGNCSLLLFYPRGRICKIQTFRLDHHSMLLWVTRNYCFWPYWIVKMQCDSIFRCRKQYMCNFIPNHVFFSWKYTMKLNYVKEFRLKSKSKCHSLF